MTKDEAMKLALEALENHSGNYKLSKSECVTHNAAIDALREALAKQPAQQEPVALKWQQAPIRTAWGDDMVVASVAIDKDHTLSLYCERDQTPKVDAVFAQRTWVGLTDEEIGKCIDEVNATSQYGHHHFGWHLQFARAIEAKLKEKNT